MDGLGNFFFGGTTAAYTLAGCAHLLHVYRREWAAMARWTTRAAWAVHTLTLVMLIVATGRGPVHTPFEAALFFTWLLMLGYLIWERLLHNQSAGAFLVPLVLLLVVTGVVLPKPGDEVFLDLSTSLLVWHATVTLLGYACFSAAFVAGLMYLLQEKLLRDKSFSPMYYRLPALASLDAWSLRFIAIGFPLLTFGLLTGVLYASARWGDVGRWTADPKVLWSFFTWAMYGAYLAARALGGLGARKAAWWAAAGFAAILVNLVVINAFLSQWHRFGS